MLSFSPGCILLSANCLTTETPFYRNTTVMKKGATSLLPPFAGISLFEETVLAGGQTLEIPVAERSLLILIPLLGEVALCPDIATTAKIGVGQVYNQYFATAGSISVSNPKEAEALASFICMQVALPDMQEGFPKKTVLPLPISHASAINTSTLCFTRNNAHIKVGVGQWHGRQAVEYGCNSNQLLFFYVLQGAFEVDGRLLHAKDALGLWNTHLVEAEALSNDATLLLVEMPLP